MVNTLRDMMHELVVFSGSAHRPLAQAICDNLGVSLAPVELTRFSNDCLQAQLQANPRTDGPAQAQRGGGNAAGIGHPAALLCAVQCFCDRRRS